MRSDTLRHEYEDYGLHVILCSLADGQYQLLEEFQGWRQQVSTKYWYQCTKLNGITPQIAVI
jgi:hypothetical protein